MPTTHIPVLPDEVLQWLAPRPGAVLVDGTLGAGGHTRLLAEQVGDAGRVIALDRDPTVVQAARPLVDAYPRVSVVQANYADLGQVLAAAGVARADGILLDLGLSSDQLADPRRGFSFEQDGPLDLRFDPNRGEPAWALLERWNERTLADVIYQFGQERFSRRIARRIVQTRRQHPIRTSGQLADLVRRCVPRSRGHRIDPATRTFQALRIAVNGEIESLNRALAVLPDLLLPGGRLVIIAFHSLEDRPVKQAFRQDPRLENLTRKPIRPTAAEVLRNPRSRSAKLRAAQRRPKVSPLGEDLRPAVSARSETRAEP